MPLLIFAADSSTHINDVLIDKTNGKKNKKLRQKYLRPSQINKKLISAKDLNLETNFHTSKLACFYH